jgi:hypothetical protein
MEPLLRLFPQMPFMPGEGIRGATRSLFTEPAFPALLQETAIAMGIFGAVLLLAWAFCRWKHAS